MALVPPSFIRKYAAMPVAKSDNTLVVAMADPNNVEAIDQIQQVTGLKIHPIQVPVQEIAKAMTALFTRRDPDESA